MFVHAIYIGLLESTQGPNPCKVVIFLEEFNRPYETQILHFGILKQESYASINPNGRVPSIEDPNTCITLWEVSALLNFPDINPILIFPSRAP